MARAWWLLRLALKRALCRLGCGDRLTEYCTDCGREQPLVWWSDNALWERVTGHATPEGDNAAGVLCPECFDRRARLIGLRLVWSPAAEGRADG